MYEVRSTYYLISEGRVLCCSGMNFVLMVVMVVMVVGAVALAILGRIPEAGEKGGQ